MARLRVLRYVLCVVCDAPVVDINVGIGFEIVLLATCCVESFGVSVSSVSVLYCDGDACVVAVCDAFVVYGMWRSITWIDTGIVERCGDLVTKRGLFRRGAGRLFRCFR